MFAADWNVQRNQVKKNIQKTIQTYDSIYTMRFMQQPTVLAFVNQFVGLFHEQFLLPFYSFFFDLKCHFFIIFVFLFPQLLFDNRQLAQLTLMAESLEWMADTVTSRKIHIIHMEYVLIYFCFVRCVLCSTVIQFLVFIKVSVSLWTFSIV